MQSSIMNYSQPNGYELRSTAYGILVFWMAAKTQENSNNEKNIVPDPLVNDDHAFRSQSDGLLRY
jgi:hypothetical protein